jgi:type VI protein secretion system component VasF
VKPNRLAILFLGFVFSLAGGFGTVAMLEALDRTVRGGRGVANLVGAPPLAVIPHIESPGDRRRRNARRVLTVVLFLVGLVLVLLALHFFVRPLDVAWFILMRRLGL